jgi:putative membrane protein insertion efficiency factor
MKFIAKQLIKFYKIFFSPIVGKSCRYTPTCSSYAYQAIDKYGAFIGSFMAIYRIMKCNPFSKGGLDPVRENLRGGMKWLL